MTSDIPMPDCGSDFEEPEEVPPLVGPGLQWYYQKGVNAVTNLVRSEERMKNTVIMEDNIFCGTATGTLNENVDVLIDKLSLAGSLKQQEHLSTMVSLGRYILENGLLVATQDLAKQYKKMKGLKESNRMESSRFLEIMSKHLNVVQIYIEGKGYITENRGKEVVQLVDSIQNVERMDQQIVNNKVKQAIGGRRGRYLKSEQFPDLAGILEFAFGKGDRVDRAGGVLESHPRLIDTVLYSAADSNTIMRHARQTILALAPEGFNIGLSSCFNYTQNYRAGTYQAKRHHTGRGINACLSLHNTHGLE